MVLRPLLLEIVMGPQLGLVPSADRPVSSTHSWHCRPWPTPHRPSVFGSPSCVLNGTPGAWGRPWAPDTVPHPHEIPEA